METEVLPSEPEDATVGEFKDQRDRALACAILSLAIALALVTSNFPGNRAPINAARESIEIHRKLISDTQDVLHQNQAVLRQNQDELTRVRKAVGH